MNFAFKTMDSVLKMAHFVLKEGRDQKECWLSPAVRGSAVAANFDWTGRLFDGKQYWKTVLENSTGKPFQPRLAASAVAKAFRWCVCESLSRSITQSCIFSQPIDDVIDDVIASATVSQPPPCFVIFNPKSIILNTEFIILNSNSTNLRRVLSVPLEHSRDERTLCKCLQNPAFSIQNRTLLEKNPNISIEIDIFTCSLIS